MLTRSKTLKSDILNLITWFVSSSKQTEEAFGTSSCDSIEEADADLRDEELHITLCFLLPTFDDCPAKRRGTGKTSLVDKFICE